MFFNMFMKALCRDIAEKKLKSGYFQMFDWFAGLRLFSLQY